jgi:hypothetical protein
VNERVIAATQQERDVMHAVVVNVTINDREAAESELRDQLVPWASQTPGFVTGYWTIKDNTGLTMIMYESEDAANHMSEQVRSAVPGAVTLENVEVRAVAAHA